MHLLLYSAQNWCLCEWGLNAPTVAPPFLRTLHAPGQAAAACAGVGLGLPLDSWAGTHTAWPVPVFRASQAPPLLFHLFLRDRLPILTFYSLHVRVSGAHSPHTAGVSTGMATSLENNLEKMTFHSPGVPYLTLSLLSINLFIWLGPLINFY